MQRTVFASEELGGGLVTACRVLSRNLTQEVRPTAIRARDRLVGRNQFSRHLRPFLLATVGGWRTYSDMCDGPPRQPARVLLLEDDVAFSAILVEFLAGEGFDVAARDSYTSLREALDAANRPIVVADFWGASHAKLSPCERDEIRELGGFTPTVLLTARAWAAAVSADELNVACILPKPVDLDELVAQVLRCLQRMLDRE